MEKSGDSVPKDGVDQDDADTDIEGAEPTVTNADEMIDTDLNVDFHEPLFFNALWFCGVSTVVSAEIFSILRQNQVHHGKLYACIA